MSVDNANRTGRPSTPGAASWTDAHAYDPLVRGPYPVGVRTLQVLDTVRYRLFPCEVWYPAAAWHVGQDSALATQDVFTVPPADTPRRQMAVRDAPAERRYYPLTLFSHSSRGWRRQSTFLCTHLSSHGYVVAALDHSETIASELKWREGETAAHVAGIGAPFLRMRERHRAIVVRANIPVRPMKRLNHPTSTPSKLQQEERKVGGVAHRSGRRRAVRA